MKKILDYVKPYWINYVFAAFCLIAAVLLEMASPQVVKIIINEVFVDRDLSRLYYLLGLLIVIGIGRGIFGYYKEFTFDWSSQHVATEMRKDIFNHIQTLSMDYFDNSNTGEIMARVKDDVDKVKDAFGMLGMITVQIAFHIACIIYFTFRLNWLLALVPLFVMIVGAALGFYMEKSYDKVYSDISEENATLTTVAEENLAGVRTVKAFARESYEIEKFKKHNYHYYELNMDQTKILVRFYPVYQFIGAILPIICAVLGGMLIIRGQMDIGSLVAFVEYTRKCTWPLDGIAEIANEISSSFASYKKIKAIADIKPTLKETENPIHLDEIRGDIRFEGVSLSIDGKNILEDIDIDFPRGKTIGIMGATGSGKSSIVNVLERFYDPIKGRVTIDGVDIREMELSQVRSLCAVVMQDVFLFSDTIEENIKMGQRDSMKLEKVKEAATAAQASEFIEKMEEQYETVIGEKGVGLSGGQKQRISMARALSKDAPVLVFDDSTSALDMETEHEVQNVLREIKDSSKLIIAHRISSVRNADEIIYLKDGRIAERGTHDELLAKKGLYYETYKAQYPELKKEVV